MPELEFISKRGLANELVISEGVIRGWLQRHWTKGIHYVVIGQTTLINKKQFNEWINTRSLEARQHDNTTTRETMKKT